MEVYGLREEGSSRATLGRGRVFLTLVGMLAVQSIGARARADSLYVDTLNLTLATQGWATTRANQSSDGNTLTIGGTTFARGFGTHAGGRLAISLPGSATRFTATVGLDDEISAGAPANRSKVQFRVVDETGRVLFDRTLNSHDAPRTASIDVNVSGVHTLYLLSGTSDDTFEFDHADWANAIIEYTGAAPVAIAPPAPPMPTIAAPSLTGAPRFNGASVFGVFPGSDVVHTAAVSGSRPMTFTATGLPSGVSISASNGALSGTAPAAGTYTFDVVATNASGTATRRYSLVVGNELARTPPMGWNTYDSYGDSVTEAEVLANAMYIRDNLLPFGWDTVVVDYRWYDATPINNGGGDNNDTLIMDANGRLQPATGRFPSAAAGAGFGPLADQIHAMGLRFGIHIMRGIPQDAVQNPADITIAGSTHTVDEAGNTNSNCRWLVNDMYGVRGIDTQTYYGTCYACSVLTPTAASTAAQQEAGAHWYRSIVNQYADWGVDFIKADDMSSGGGGNERAPYSAGEIEHLHNAIVGSGRSIVLSLSPGETPLASLSHLNVNGNMWRISDDFWDRWGDVEHIFGLANRWKGAATVGHWPDADMLPLGYLGPRCPVDGTARPTRLTQQEQLTMMSLWAVMPSPYMLGANMTNAGTTSDVFTMSLLTNPDVIDIHQDALGKKGQPISLGLIDGWVRELSNGDRAVALFNRSDIPTLTPTVTFASLGLSGAWFVRNAWAGTDVVPTSTSFTVEVGAHGAVLLRLYAQPTGAEDGGVPDASQADASGSDSGAGPDASTGPGGSSGCGCVAAGSANDVTLPMTMGLVLGVALVCARRRRG